MAKSENFEGFFGDVKFNVAGEGDLIDLVSIVIPDLWYNVSKHLTVSFMTTYGVNNFKMTAICNDTIHAAPIPSSTPSVMPSTVPVSVTSLAPSALPTVMPTCDCTQGAHVISSGSAEMHGPPVEIIYFDNKTVTFSISQVWTDGKVCEIATEYESPTVGEICEYSHHVPPGQYGYFTAVCVDGKATATVYAHDIVFGKNNSVDGVPAGCGPLTSGDYTIEYQLSIPCVFECDSCPPFEYPCCNETNNFVVADEFGGNDAASWLFGVKRFSAEFGYYLGGAMDAPDGSEVTKTFVLPAASPGLHIEFDLYELKSSDALIRLQDTYFVIGSFDASVTEGSYEGFLGDIWMTATGIDATSDHVTFVVPDSWFNASNHFTVSFVMNYGVNNFKMQAICNSTLSKNGPSYGH